MAQVRTKVLRLPSPVAVLPVVGHARVAQDELYQIGEACLRAHIIGKDDHAAFALLKAHDCVCGLLIVSAFEKAMSLRPIKDHNAQSREEIFALLAHWKHRSEVQELVCGGEVQLGLSHL